MDETGGTAGLFGVTSHRRDFSDMIKILLSALLLGAMSSMMYGRDREESDNENEGRDEINTTSDHHAPEVDPNSAISAMFLLSSGVLMIKGRRKR